MNDISITLTEQEWNGILSVLAERPYREVWIIIHKMQTQVQARPVAETPQ